MSTAMRLHGRYEILRRLGQGGMGVVYLAHDTTLDRHVALKSVHALDPERIYRLKKEFRSLAELVHPNLVQLYDLVATEHDCFFTMELIEGKCFVEAFGRVEGTRPRPDYKGLRLAIGQLALGLGALHRRRKLHRDIKPTNVLVEESGRIVLVDFGLASDQLSRASRDSQMGSLVGTLDYMAPEQLFGEAISPAADWYAVGAMLYEALTGRTPLQELGQGAVLSRSARIPSSPRDLVPDTPADLDALVMALLRPVAAERPGLAEVLGAFPDAAGGSASTGGESDAVPAEPTLFGRAEELEALERFFRKSARRTFATVRVSGPSGIGKTELVEQFLRRLEARDEALILRARCHPQESLPFRALDGVVDDLSRFLARQPKESVRALLPSGAAVLSRLFPVMGRVVPETGEPDGEPHEVRRRAFAAFRELLARVTAFQPTVLWIDDLQWGDLDSAALIRELRRAPDPPRLLLLLSHRREPEGEGAAIDEGFASRFSDGSDEPALELHLAPLSNEASREFAIDLLAGADASGADAIARESGGNPFLICELARHARGTLGRSAVGLAQIVDERIRDLPAATRRVLDLVAISGEPVSEQVLYRLGATGQPVREAIGALRAQYLVRAAVQRGEPAFDIYHDRIRQAIVGLLGEDERRRLHGEIAEVLETLPDIDAHRLVAHSLGAGDAARAAKHALHAAEGAAEAMAFERAASLFRRALELGTAAAPIWQINARLGEALIHAGRGGEGAARLAEAALLLASEQPGSIEALRLKRRAAEHYMRSGLHSEGFQAMREVLALANVRYARTPTIALASVLLNRARLWLGGWLDPPRIPSNAGAFERERLEVCWSAGVGLAVFDGIRAADFHLRAALMARRAGDRGHLARALATEGLLMAWEGGGRKRRLSQRLRRAGERLARETGDPNTRAHSHLMSAVSAFYEMRLRDALALCEEGERLCRERCVGAHWELATLQVLTGNTLACLGELGRLAEHLPEVLRQAKERGDEYCLVTARLGYANSLWLAADRPDEARRQAE
ncbi:MAG: protein kinase domain-containing protein, partial [Myxococcota bacterium]